MEGRETEKKNNKEREGGKRERKRKGDGHLAEWDISPFSTGAINPTSFG